MPTIAAVSRVEMITRKRSSLSGTKIVVEAGQIKMISETGCPVGTSVFITRIFDPVPVRRKFLKSDSTEQGHCVDIITKMALAHPGLRLMVTSNGKDILSIPATGNESERISLILGMDFMNHMLPVKQVKGEVIIRGFISRPEQTRSSTKHLYFYVNRRYIRDYLLNHAVMTAYRSLIETKRFPAVVLFVELTQDDVDVNVHPTKMEVRFRNPRDIYDITVEALVSALSRIQPITAASASTVSSPEMPRRSHTDYRMRVEEALKRYTLSSGHGKLFFNQGAVHTERRRFEEADLYKQSENTMPEPGAPRQTILLTDLEYLGQAAGTYLVFSSPAGITIVDQHAAHERVLFEKIKEGAYRDDRMMIGQRLLIPEVVSLTPRDFAFLTESIGIIEDTGIEVEPFGGNAVVVKSMPAMLAHIQPKEIITDLLDAFSGEDRGMKIQERKEKIFAFLACRGAVKANHPLSSAEVSKLCQDLDKTSFSTTCPHGRPIYVSFSFSDLEKMFKRK